MLGTILDNELFSSKVCLFQTHQRIKSVTEQMLISQAHDQKIPDDANLLASHNMNIND